MSCIFRAQSYDFLLKYANKSLPFCDSPKKKSPGTQASPPASPPLKPIKGSLTGRYSRRGRLYVRATGG